MALNFRIWSFVILFLFWSNFLFCQNFSFAVISDLHIEYNSESSSEDLLKCIEKINSIDSLDFVIVSGDITENGDKLSLSKAKLLLDLIKIPYYIISGNHDTKWSESGCTDFAKIFGYERFYFSHKNYHFFGFTSGPILKMGDGHIAQQDLNWLKGILDSIPANHGIFPVTHYPLLPQDLDNWYDLVDILLKYNIVAVLGGHYHQNRLYDYNGVRGILNRSSLTSKKDHGGFNIYNVSDSLRIKEVLTDSVVLEWLTLPIKPKNNETKNYQLPDYSINTNYKNIELVWIYNASNSVYSTPAILKNSVFFGDESGYLYCLNLKDGTIKWKFSTTSRIFSSPAIGNSKIVFGSTDNYVYCLDTENGGLKWKINTGNPVTGSPAIDGNVVYIGNGSGKVMAIELDNGKLLWTTEIAKTYIETKPLLDKTKIFFGAWDTNFYALNKKDGTLNWKWNNGNTRMHFSPAAVLPISSGNKIFIVAPDRYWTALDKKSGKVIWRTNEFKVRETIGISKDKKKIYSRTLDEHVIALSAIDIFPKVVWNKQIPFGYDHAPSMLMENNNIVIFGTKNGLLNGINSKNGNLLWQYKFGNSIINTIVPLNKNEFIISTVEGKVARIKY
jgi:outer membrane protein assembly factor BamB